MRDTEVQQVLCLACGNPLQQKHGKRARLYCNDVCKTTYHRRKEREEEQAARLARWSDYPRETRHALEAAVIHSAELASIVEEGINAAAGAQVNAAREAATRKVWELQKQVQELEQERDLHQNTQVYQEKLTQAANRIEKLERQVEIQKERLGQSYQSHSAQSARIAELEQELRKSRDRGDRAKLEARFMALGEHLQYRSLQMSGVLGGSGYWRAFLERADDETLSRAVDAAEAFYENLTAPKNVLSMSYAHRKSFEHQAKRIAELEEQVRQLQELLDGDNLYRLDTKERTLQAWLKRQGTYPPGSVQARLIADKAIPQRASRALYEQTLKKLGYSDEDRAVFRDLWIAMLRKA